VKATRDVTRQEILSHLSLRISKSKMPQRYYRVKDFPMTSNGKLQRNRLSPTDDRYVTGELR
jgi:acyl-CoA synthetase (AMP-forming)/AMP-acid ligase II